MLRKLESLLLAILGVVLVADGWRIGESFRSTGGFGIVGPDRYVIGLGISLVFVAIVYALAGARVLAVASGEGEPQESGRALRAALYGGLTFAYVALLPLAGYAISTLVFFIAGFWLGDKHRPWLCVMAGIIATLASYVLFVVLAGVSFPVASLF